MTASDDFTSETDAPAPRATDLSLSVANEQSHVTFDIETLTRISTSLLRDEGVPLAEISLAIVDDATIHAINRQYLNHDCPTDVISFLLSEPNDDGVTPPMDVMEGEIVISGETAARVAGEMGCPPHEELALYLVHGLLHLCGYDDQTPADRETMQSRERVHLQKFGIEPHY
ncbi:MAG: rRNA maturation RNase YbeY [Planctomycetaceae bacterium]|nr:rRNA maturation RNase YbeY [Planctomycetaceae bacterium]